MKHKEKLKIARRMIGKSKGGFQSEAWEKRKEAIVLRVKKREGKI